MIKIGNSYREGSNLYQLFEELRDGMVHDTQALSLMLYGMTNKNLRLRVAALLRKIRGDQFNGVDIIYVPHANRYYMIPTTTKGYRYVGRRQL